MTNFQADQGGRIRFRFFLLPGPTRSLGASAQAALAYARPPAAHLYAGRGELRHAAGALLTPDLGPLLLTRLEPDGDGVALTLLNPEDRAVEADRPAGRAHPRQGAPDDTLRRTARGSRLHQRHGHHSRGAARLDARGARAGRVMGQRRRWSRDQGGANRHRFARRE